MGKLTIKDILKGTTVGNIQTVGVMQVIPLLSDIEFNDYVSPAEAGTFENRNYGNMIFGNDSDKTMIVPNNSTYITKQAAQDHAMMHAGLVARKSKKGYDTAACVQETQGGMVGVGKYDFVILPFSLRESAMNVRKNNSYGKLWPAIKQFNNSFGISDSRGHLEFFFKKFNKELEEFVAEFEIITKQVGAIILIKGQVVGVERAPNYSYWKSIWSQTVRGCYGTYALNTTMNKRVTKKDLDAIRTPLKLKNIKDLDSLEKELNKSEKSQEKKIKDIVRSLIDDEFKSEVDEKLASNERIQVSNDQFAGQIVKESDTIVYASIISKGDWLRNEKWHRADDFKI